MLPLATGFRVAGKRRVALFQAPLALRARKMRWGLEPVIKTEPVEVSRKVGGVSKNVGWKRDGRSKGCQVGAGDLYVTQINPEIFAL